MKLKEYYIKVEKILASMKFAVTIIVIYTLMMVYGTFQESYHGADFANRLVYKSWWFMGIQLLMFMSILVATVVRLPARKSLYGFYTIHTGLLTLFIGSFVTFVVGIDGQIQLIPNTPSKKIVISNKNYLKIAMVDKNKAIKFPLPYTHKQTKMDGDYQQIIKMKEYIPYANVETVWKPSNMPNKQLDQGSTFLIFNENVSQKFTLSLNPTSDFKSTQKLGPLSIHYMPNSLYKCFSKKSKSGFLIWNTDDGSCFTAEEREIRISKTPQGNRFLAMNHQGKNVKFFPDLSPVAVNDDLSRDENVAFRVFSRNLFTDKPHLFIFGDKVAFYKKGLKRWRGKTFENDETITLPWMNFKLRLIDYKIAQTPYQIPRYTKPIQDKGEIIEGNIQAVKVSIMNSDYWVRSDAPLAISNGTSQIRFSIGPKEIALPFQITLKKFKMDKNPGTNSPASYESFVSLFDSRKDGISEDYHVFMNNPLKYDDFTFYQSSYFPIGPDSFASVFSANYDPGRPLKYAGSLLLVLGSIWHFYIRRKKKKIIRIQNA